MAAETGGAPDQALIRRIVDTYAGAAMQQGRAIGLGVAVVLGDGPTSFFTYGVARRATERQAARPMTSRTLFEIGSNTKVFTTNLLGQFVAEGQLALSDPLARWQDKIGNFSRFEMGPLKAEITLGQLGSFTAGLGDTPERCQTGQKPAADGCVPPYRSFYPPTSLYGAKDFLAYLAKRPLMDWQRQPPTQLLALPAPYQYSNYSTALIGLLLATPDGERISNRSVLRWSRLVERRLLEPLGLDDTTLRVPAKAAGRVANGYSRAVATGVVTNGRVTSCIVSTSGRGYGDSPPAVTIRGGGGTGATARALVANGSVRSIEVTRRGRGYIAPPTVVLVNPRTGEERTVRATVAVANGSVTGVVLSEAVAAAEQPHVVIRGGLGPGLGRPAGAVARMVAGNVRLIEVLDGGAGYVEPLAVVIAPGRQERTAVPIFAPAGFLKSSLRDMARFVRAAMGATVVDGRPVPPVVTSGFEIAQRPYACETGAPELARCRTAARDGLSGLAWQVYPGDGAPDVLEKNGALLGFTSQIMLVPQLRLGVVVFATAGWNTNIAGDLASAVLYDLYFRSLGDGTARGVPMARCGPPPRLWTRPPSDRRAGGWMAST